MILFGRIRARIENDTDTRGRRPSFGQSAGRLKVPLGSLRSERGFPGRSGTEAVRISRGSDAGHWPIALESKSGGLMTVPPPLRFNWRSTRGRGGRNGKGGRWEKMSKPRATHSGKLGLYTGGTVTEVVEWSYN